MRVKIIACEVMQEELLSIEPLDGVDYEFVPMKFHLYPDKLHIELQRIIDKSIDYSRIILAFGLCGGAAKNLKSASSILTIPRVHDCISIFLGSRKNYERISKIKKGTFYLTSGWMRTEKSILSEHERISRKYGEKKSLKILNKMYDSYKRILYIQTGNKNEEDSIEKSKEISKLLSLDYEMMKGSNEFIKKIALGPWNDEEFININPKNSISEEDFGICNSIFTNI
ncbi:MAG: DUF1638 domain-containing protein [Bacillota bacterium]|nr:DUF1638 domain-containing protein [Bacillota bacterium]